MKVLIAVFKDIYRQSQRLKPSLKKGWFLWLLVFCILLIGIKFFISTNVNNNSNEIETKNNEVLVEVAPASSFLSEKSITLVGIVRSVNEAQIHTKLGGRVTSVLVKAGDMVKAGSIIATIENESEKAALIQAEGVYEAALAAAAQSNISVNETTNNLNQSLKNAENVYQSAYTTVSDIVYNSLDTFYSNPDSGVIGLKIDAGNSTGFLNSERIAYRSLLPLWQNKTGIEFTLKNYQELITEAIAYTERTRTLVDTFLENINTAKRNETLNDQPIISFSSKLNTNRTNLSNVISSLKNSEITIQNSEEALKKAEIGGTTNVVSSANSQIKQALGSLRSAQANYEKTILRTPITGVINFLRINNGDYLTPSTLVAEVANNNALEISIFVGESDLALVKVGDKVTIDNDIEGTIVSVAPGIDSLTQKTEVKIAAESTSLINGDTVVVHLKTKNDRTDSKLFVPITAVKFAAKDGSVFVIEDNRLVSIPVKIGVIQNNEVEITSGIDAKTEIVKDARGLSAGQKVTTQ